MNKGALINFRKFKVNKFFKINKIVFLMCLLFVIGLIIGLVLLSKNKAVLAFSKKVFSDYFILRSKKSFFKIFFSSFLSSLVFLLFIFVSGASVLGVITVPFFVTAKGFLFGILCGYAFNTFSLKGVAFNAMILIPGSIVGLISYLFAAKHSVLFSCDFIKLIFPKSRPINLFGGFRDYTYKYFTVVCFTLISALSDAAVSHFFIKFFNFSI